MVQGVTHRQTVGVFTAMARDSTSPPPLRVSILPNNRHLVGQRTQNRIYNTYKLTTWS